MTFNNTTPDYFNSMRAVFLTTVLKKNYLDNERLMLQPPVSVLSNTVFSLLVKCRVCKKPVRRYDVGAPAGITISLPGAESQDAERRRQIALRALSGIPVHTSSYSFYSCNPAQRDYLKQKLLSPSGQAWRSQRRVTGRVLLKSLNDSL